MRLSELPQSEIVERLRHTGLLLEIGPYTFSLRSDLPRIAEAVSVLYADFPCLEKVSFVDFYFGLHRDGGLRRVFAPTITVSGEGRTMFERIPLGSAVAYWEWGLNRCIAMHANQHLMLHAAALDRGGKGLVIVGDTGAGKSTLSAALTLSGWRLMSDEFGMLEMSTREVHALSRPIALKNESLDVIRGFAPEVVIGPVSKATLKGDVAHVRPPRRCIDQVLEPTQPRMFIFVNYTPGASVDLKPLTKGEAMYRVARNTFNYGITAERGFSALADVIDQSESFEFTYSDLHEGVAALTDRFDAIVKPAAQLPRSEVA